MRFVASTLRTTTYSKVSYELNPKMSTNMTKKMTNCGSLLILAVVMVSGVAAVDSFPPQCDVQDLMQFQTMEFMGPVKSLQVGTINFSYHDFGPSYQGRDDDQAEAPSPESDPAPAPGPDPSVDAESEEQPRTLLLIHGFGSTQYDWPLPMLEVLAYDRRVIVFDNPRIGMSTDTSEEALTIDYMANATLGLIRELGIDRPDIIGYSMGGAVALSVATRFADEVGGVVAVAAPIGGPEAPQPPGGLAPVLAKLSQIYLSKYVAQSTGNDASAGVGFFNAAATSSADPEDDVKLFFPLGVLDPAACNLLKSFFSLQYAVGYFTAPGSGYALPGEAYPDGIIPEPPLAAIAPTPEILMQQSAALMRYFEDSNVANALPSASRQILYISGVQDNVIPVTSQLQAAKLTPAAWLQQVTDAGHGIVFKDPEGFAFNALSFLESSQDISTMQKAYYQPPNSGAATVLAAYASLVLGAVLAVVIV